VRHCIDLGINFFDTARAYTDSEEKIGAALVELPRDSFILASKTLSKTGPEMARDIDLSLKNLKVGHIDLYQCHNVRYDADVDALFAPGGGLDALLAAKQAGKIRHIGVTGHLTGQLLKLLQTGKFETVQFPYNFTEQKAAAELIPYAIKENIGTIIMKPLGGSALPADLGLRFFLDKQVDVVIVGMENMGQVEQNARTVAAARPISTAGELEEIAEVGKALGNDYCRRCDYCKPCPQDIDIARLLIIRGYLKRYNMEGWSYNLYQAQKVRADACVRCGDCATRCPYDLPIPEVMADTARLFAELEQRMQKIR